jgi:hypothetical protein
MSKSRNIADLGSNDVLETTATGVDVTGTISATSVTADGLTVDGSSTTDSITYTANSDFPSTGVTLNSNGFSYEMTGSQGKIFRSENNTKALMQIGGDNNFQLYEDTGTTPKMTWDASAESLGIGTSSPSAQLHIDGESNGTLRVDTTANGYLDLSMYSNGAFIGTSDEEVLRFGTNNTERMRIDSAGNVGIGTASPSNHLHVHDATAGDVAVTSNTSAMRLVSTSSANYIQSGTSLSGNSANLIFTGTNGVNERARIDSSGNLLVGTTDTDLGYTDGDDSGVVIDGASGSIQIARSSHYAKLYINTKNNEGALVDFHKDGTKVGSITHNGSSAVSYNTTSDERLKENIQDTTHTVDINDLQVREFDWKVDGSHQRYGFIAQELETVYPEAVHSPEDADEMMSVDYSKLVPLLVKEIQTLKAEIKELKA